MRHYFLLLVLFVFFGLLRAQSTFSQDNFSTSLDSAQTLFNDLKNEEIKKLLDSLSKTKNFKVKSNYIKWNIVSARYNYRIKNFSSALENYFSARDAAAEFKDSASLVRAYLGMAIIYKELNLVQNYDECVVKADSIVKQFKDTLTHIRFLNFNGIRFSAVAGVPVRWPLLRVIHQQHRPLKTEANRVLLSQSCHAGDNTLHGRFKS